jgi:hypothetical protein
MPLIVHRIAADDCMSRQSCNNTRPCSYVEARAVMLRSACVVPGTQNSAQLAL